MTDDQLRRRLLEAAAEVFAERGYEGARVQQIAERAELTTGAIYNRFSGKSELLLEAAELHSDDLLGLLLASGLRSTDVLGAAAANLVAAKPTLGQTLTHEMLLSARREPDLAAKIRPQMAQAVSELAARVKADQADGLIDADIDVRSLTTLAHAVALGMSLLQMLEMEMPEPDNWQHLIDRVLDAYKPTGDDMPQGEST
jgi:AcrR family transcriptional regulator